MYNIQIIIAQILELRSGCCASMSGIYWYMRLRVTAEAFIVHANSPEKGTHICVPFSGECGF
jgi:hypothetical protein